MRIKKIFILKYLLLLLCGFVSLISFGQDSPEKKQIQAVFDQLVTAYGSARTQPELIVFQSSDKQIMPAKYDPLPKPNIQVDGSLVTIFKAADPVFVNTPPKLPGSGVLIVNRITC